MLPTRKKQRRSLSNGRLIPLMHAQSPLRQRDFEQLAWGEFRKTSTLMGHMNATPKRKRQSFLICGEYIRLYIVSLTGSKAVPKI